MARGLLYAMMPASPAGDLVRCFMVVLKKILVATDFGEASTAALNYGRELARTFGATLHVVHVVENVISRYGADFAIADFSDAQKQVEEAAKKQLNSLLSDEDRETLHATPVLRVSMAPDFAIVQYANEEKVDLIVTGTHGRGAVAHFLLGSVAERVVRSAPCPVLTVRSPEREFVLPDALVAVEKA